MSPRAAWRLEALGFDPQQVYDYVEGKADWLANGLPREGQQADVPYAGDIADTSPPICALTATVAELRAALDSARHGFCLVINERRIVLGRVRRSMLDDAAPGATAEAVMDAGPSTVRYSTPARDLVRRLVEQDLKTAVITTPSGCLVGVFDRAEAERHLDTVSS
jgi:predicted transcriptional regulator